MPPKKREKSFRCELCGSHSDVRRLSTEKNHPQHGAAPTKVETCVAPTPPASSSAPPETTKDRIRRAGVCKVYFALLCAVAVVAFAVGVKFGRVGGGGGGRASSEVMERNFPLSEEIAGQRRVLTSRMLGDVVMVLQGRAGSFVEACVKVVDAHVQGMQEERRGRWRALLERVEAAAVEEQMRGGEKLRWREWREGERGSVLHDDPACGEEGVQWEEETREFVAELLDSAIQVALAAPHLSLGTERAGDVVVFDEAKHAVVNGQCSRCRVLLPSLLASSGMVAARAAVVAL